MIQILDILVDNYDDIYKIKNINNTIQFVKLLSSYTGKESKNFKGIVRYLQVVCNSSERNYFFEFLLPNIINIAVDIKLILYNSNLLLKDDIKISKYTKYEILVLLTNSFLCAYKQNSSFSTMNFTDIFTMRDDVSSMSYSDYINSKYISRLYSRKT